jgi:hypothetical protein
MSVQKMDYHLVLDIKSDVEQVVVFNSEVIVETAKEVNAKNWITGVAMGSWKKPSGRYYYFFNHIVSLESKGLCVYKKPVCVR